MSALVEVRNLRRTFDVSKPWLERVLGREGKLVVKAVDGVTFDIPKGTTFALVGESGSGKSTVARMVAGLLPPSGGTISIDGNLLDKKHGYPKELRRRMQMIFQDPYASLDPRWRVGDIIAEPMRAFAINSTRSAEQKRVAELLKLVGMHPDSARKFPHEFSGGQRQRVAIARALASDAEFIICDEPTSALDVSVQAQILNLMKELQQKFGLTYLFISHNLAVVRHMATSIGVMHLGRLVEQGPAEELFTAPRHPYTRLLLESVPDLGMSGRPRRAMQGEIPSPIHPPPGCAFNPRCPFVNERCIAEDPQSINGVACHAVEEGRISAKTPLPA